MDRRTKGDTEPGEEQREPDPVRADGRPADDIDEVTTSGGTGPSEADHHNTSDADEGDRFDAG